MGGESLALIQVKAIGTELSTQKKKKQMVIGFVQSRSYFGRYTDWITFTICLMVLIYG